MTKINALRTHRSQLVGLVMTAVGLLAAGAANAETSSGNFMVSVSVVANCTVTSPGTQSVATTCSNGATGIVTYGHALSASSTTSGSSAAHQDTVVATVTF